MPRPPMMKYWPSPPPYVFAYCYDQLFETPVCLYFCFKGNYLFIWANHMLFELNIACRTLAGHRHEDKFLLLLSGISIKHYASNNLSPSSRSMVGDCFTLLALLGGDSCFPGLESCTVHCALCSVLCSFVLCIALCSVLCALCAMCFVALRYMLCLVVM